MKRALGFAVLLLVLGAIGFLVLVYGNRNVDGGRVWTGNPSAHSLEALVGSLEEAGVIENGELFTIYLRIMGASSRMREHEVVVPPKSSPFFILRVIAKGYGEKQRRVLIREGLNRFEIADVMEDMRVCTARDFVAATEDPALLRELEIDGASAEGYLFPDTYALRTPSEAADVVRRMVGNFRKKTGLAKNRSDYEVLTLASIVEEEAQRAEERATVAGVFVNRMRDPSFQPKRLQADPTVAYGCHADPRLSSCTGFNGRRITKTMLQDRSNPYNTYRHEGLPPGPISNPGLASIEAAREPSQHDYLYFVAKGDGSHAFSRTLEEHNANVSKYVLNQGQ